MIQKAIDLGVSNLHPPGASGPNDQPSRSTMRIWTNHPRSAVEVTDCDFVDTSGPLPFPSPKARVFSDSRTARRNRWFNAMVPVIYTYVYIYSSPVSTYRQRIVNLHTYYIVYVSARCIHALLSHSIPLLQWPNIIILYPDINSRFQLLSPRESLKDTTTKPTTIRC